MFALNYISCPCSIKHHIFILSFIPFPQCLLCSCIKFIFIYNCFLSFFLGLFYPEGSDACMPRVISPKKTNTPSSTPQKPGIHIDILLNPYPHTEAF